MLYRFQAHNKKSTLHYDGICIDLGKQCHDGTPYKSQQLGDCGRKIQNAVSAYIIYESEEGSERQDKRVEEESEDLSTSVYTVKMLQ